MQSADARAELALLRRRAYGPDADIAGDPEAVARLAELESAAPSTGAISAPADRAPDAAGTVTVPAGRAPADTSSAGRVAVEGDVSRPPDHPAPDAPLSQARRPRRSVIVLAVALIAAVVGVAATVGTTALTAERPDATLARDDVDPVIDGALDDGWPGSFRVSRNDLAGFEEYRGFRAWSATASDGLLCLFVTTPDWGLVTYSCTSPTINPVADFNIGNGTVSLGGGPRMILRFELRGDEVWVFDRPVPRGEES